MNQDYLSSLPYDVLRQVCASASSDPNLRVPLNGLSRSTKHLRDVSLPDVFRNVLIRGDWNFASSRLKAMEECHAILSFVKVFKFDIYEENGATPPPQSMPSELANLLSAMSHLEKLVFVVPEYHSELFEEAFRHSELMMRSVDILVVGPYCDFMVAICPNVTIVSNNGYQWLHSDRARDSDGARDHSMKLIRAAGATSKLRHFEMMEWWEVGLLKDLLEFIPNIASMGMDGGNGHAPLEEFLPTLSHFQHLRKLALAGAHALNVGFDPPQCGNVYMGPGGDAFRQQVEREGEEAERKVAHMIFPVCASLEELWIGDTRKAVAERFPDGSLKDITVSECDRDKTVKYPRP